MRRDPPIPRFLPRPLRTDVCKEVYVSWVLNDDRRRHASSGLLPQLLLQGGAVAQGRRHEAGVPEVCEAHGLGMGEGAAGADDAGSPPTAGLTRSQMRRVSGR